MLNENNEVVFNYQVNTIMPIIGLSVGNLMVPSTAKLTKEDVLICVKKAPVFRRFGSSKLIRVTASNLDRLHNENFMTEEEYEEFLIKQGDNRGKVTEVPVEETKVAEEPVIKEEEVPVEEEPVVTEETTVEEVPVEAETEDSAQTIEEEVSSAVEEEINDEGISEDVTENDSPVVEDDMNNHKNNNNRYNNKKKHNR